MSVVVMGEVWAARLKRQHKIVLLAYADFANHEGLCYPSLARIAWMTGYSRTQAKQIRNQLIDERLIIVKSEGGRFPGDKPMVQVNRARLAVLAGPEPADSKGSETDPIGPNHCTDMGSESDPNGVGFRAKGGRFSPIMGSDTRPLTVSNRQDPSRARGEPVDNSGSPPPEGRGRPDQPFVEFGAEIAGFDRPLEESPPAWISAARQLADELSLEWVPNARPEGRVIRCVALATRELQRRVAAGKSLPDELRSNPLLRHFWARMRAEESAA